MADAAPTEVIPVPPEDGTVTVAEKVVDKIAAHAATEVPGVVRTGRAVASAGRPSVHSEIAGGRASIQVEIALAWPTPAAATAAQVRQAVGSAVSELAGVVPDRVDVVVVAMAQPQGTGRRVR